MELCTNCDAATACYRCKNCPPLESLFCETCMNFHTKVKASRDHTFETLERQALSCANCDGSGAKFACRQCAEPSRYFCVGCSVIHPKIKQFRGHEVVALQTQRSADIPFRSGGRVPQNLKDLSATLAQAIDVAYYNFTNLSWTDARLWQTLAILLIITLAYYVVVRTFFAKYSSVVNIAVAIALYQWFQSTKLKLSEADMSVIDRKAPPAARAAALQARMHSSGSNGRGPCGDTGGPSSRGWNISLDQFNKDEFKDEFWYRTEDKKASLRPRGRPYKRTAGGSRGDAVAKSPDASNTMDATT
jgi:hypothetical protein